MRVIHHWCLQHLSPEMTTSRGLTAPMSRPAIFLDVGNVISLTAICTLHCVSKKFPPLNSKERWVMSYRCCSKFHTLSSSANFFENRLRFDKGTESLKVGTFFDTQCRVLWPGTVNLFTWRNLTNKLPKSKNRPKTTLTEYISTHADQLAPKLSLMDLQCILTL